MASNLFTIWENPPRFCNLYLNYSYLGWEGGKGGGGFTRTILKIRRGSVAIKMFSILKISEFDLREGSSSKKNLLNSKNF